MKYCDACKTSYPDDFKVCPRDQSVLRTTTELTQGTVLRNKYEILATIGVGGMATVYKARHLTFNELRALKIVSSKLTDDPLFLKRFKTEAIVTRKLKHHNAVRVEDFDETEDGRPYIVMEYVEGKNLRSVVHELKRLPLERALEIARQTAAALSAAHQLGITHRDIKPDNILLVQLPDGSEQVKVLDFGIAKLKEGSVEHTSYTPTQTGMVVGTPQYISPEQAMGKSGDQVDGRADLYSLGVVVYEMLTAKQPFESDTAMGLLLHHLNTVPTPPHVLRPDLCIPASISRVLMKALEKDPAKRFQTAGEMLEAFAAAKQQSDPMAGAVTNVMTPTVMAAASTPKPADRSPAAATTPTIDVVAPPSAATVAVLPPAPAKPPAAIDKTVAVPSPRPAPTPPMPKRILPPPPKRRSWTVPALVVVLVLVALGVVRNNHKKALPAVQAAQPAPAVVPTPDVKPAETPAPAPSPDIAKAVEKPHPAKAPAPQATPEPEATPAPEPAQQADGQQMDPEVRRLLLQGKQQYENHRYGMAMASFRHVLQLDPNNEWAKRGIEACVQARQQQSEQVLQNDPQETPPATTQSGQGWRRRR